MYLNVNHFFFFSFQPKSSKPHTHTGFNAYAQSWVFDAENAGCSNSGAVETSYFKVLQNGTPKKPRRKSNGLQVGLQNGMVRNNLSEKRFCGDNVRGYRAAVTMYVQGVSKMG